MQYITSTPLVLPADALIIEKERGKQVYLEKENETDVIEFILLGFSNSPQLDIPLFLVFLVIYLLTVLGNMGMMFIIRTDPRLHTPMYIFLSNLSFSDVCFVSVSVPKLLQTLLSNTKAISFAGCMTQLHFLIYFNTTEIFLLSAMAYDRYVAICNPMRYLLVMNSRVCLQLIISAWTVSLFNSLAQTLLIVRLPFCHSNKINHFSCDIPPLLKLSCSDTSLNEMYIFTVCVILAGSSFFLILASYIRIVSAILKINSAEGRHKAFSTCVSHLTCVTLFYGAGFIRYVRPSTSYSLDQDRFVCVLYSIVTPMLNPVIYSLRNNDVKEAMRRIMRKVSFIAEKGSDSNQLFFITKR
ncbi:olfactory receptor 1019-like [Rhinatrema bivittatum]|uniref:olfactory receptor 1019-like n=1 Tax=Rhinatrema bivittatum TaxID=194408 RepID=UPI00112EB5E0|nr:olfactory receptor 1019-like [Rhinatrema bivittatum]